MTSIAPPERLIVLCERLVHATRAREVEWRLEGEDTYLWNHEEGSVMVGARDRDGQPPYEISIFNKSRAKVEELGSSLVDGDEPAPWNPSLTDLYRAARRSALRADDIIDALIEALPPKTIPDRRET